MLDDLRRRQLAQDGYLVVSDLMSPALLSDLRREVDRCFGEEGERAGSEFKTEAGCRRLANLIDKGEVFRRLVVSPELLAHVRLVLGPDFKLSSLNARSANPRSDNRQPLHADASAVADSRGFWVCNSIWMLDHFTESNGALRVVPGSHRLRKLPSEALDDPLAPHPDEVLLTGRAGSVAILNAHAWHGALANRSNRGRRAVHAFFVRRDKPQQQYQKALVRPDVQAGMSALLRDLLAIDDPLNDELCAQSQQQSGFLR